MFSTSDLVQTKRKCRRFVDLLVSTWSAFSPHVHYSCRKSIDSLRTDSLSHSRALDTKLWDPQSSLQKSTMNNAQWIMWGEIPRYASLSNAPWAYQGEHAVSSPSICSVRVQACVLQPDQSVLTDSCDIVLYLSWAQGHRDSRDKLWYEWDVNFWLEIYGVSPRFLHAKSIHARGNPATRGRCIDTPINMHEIYWSLNILQIC